MRALALVVWARKSGHGRPGSGERKPGWCLYLFGHPWPANRAIPGRTLPTHVMPAVDGEVGAGDPGRLLAKEERHRVGDLLGLAEAAERDLGDDLLAHFLGHGHHHFGRHVAGRNGVDGDAEFRA